MCRQRSIHEVNDMVRVLAGPAALQVPRFREARDQFVRELEHVKVMRFELLDVEQRLFHVEPRVDWTRIFTKRLTAHLVRTDFDAPMTSVPAEQGRGVCRKTRDTSDPVRHLIGLVARGKRHH